MAQQQVSNLAVRGTEWNLFKQPDGYNPDQVWLSVLMDIRRELQRLNALLSCPNALDIPHILRRIDKNTQKPIKKKVKK